MFDEVIGLPMHPLVVHAVVVFVPLLVLVSLVYALAPKLRARLGWLAVTLAVIAPVTAVVAVLSGDGFQQRRGLPLEGALLDHRNLGLTTMILTLLLAAVTVALVWVRSRAGASAPAVLTGVLTVVLVIAGLGAATAVVLAGHSGSELVWQPLWPSG